MKAAQAGSPFACPFPQRAIPVLPANARLEDLVRHALLANAEVEAAYWEWRAALERVPQAGTPDTNLAVFGSHAFGAMGDAWERTTLGLQTDPMANIPPRSRLCAAAAQALDEARAAGWRFEQAKWDLRARVYDAWFDYALLAERLRVVERNAELIERIVGSTTTRVEAGRATQQNLLAARTTLDLARSEAATLRSRIPPQRATLNALLSRPPGAPLDPPEALPDVRKFDGTDEGILSLAGARSPLLEGLAAEVRAGASAVAVARTRYLPEFALTGSITGSAVQTLGGMIALPILRREAIAAAVEETRASLRAVESRRRQTGNDLAARVLLDLYGVRDADRQIDLYRSVLVPRAAQSVELGESGYSVDRTDYLELRDAQRTLLETSYTLAELQAVREKRLADLEAAVGALLAPPP
jgi:outer membrane protein TolC